MNYQNFQNLMLLTSSDTKRTLMHLFLFTNSAQRELVSICTQSIHVRNKLSLPYIDAMESRLNLLKTSQISLKGIGNWGLPSLHGGSLKYTFNERNSYFPTIVFFDLKLYS